MEYVLRIIGAIAILAGLFVGVRAVHELQVTGVPLQNALVMGAVTGAVGIIITGVLFLAFGTVIDLLRRIKNNTDRGQEL